MEAVIVQPGVGPPKLEKDVSIELTNRLIISFLHPEITPLLNNSVTNLICLRSVTIKKFVAKMNDVHFNYIGNRSEIVQELFILQQVCKGLYIYNSTHLNLSHQEFRAKILYPNLVYMLVRYLHKANTFLQSCIRAVYREIINHSYGLVQKYANSYYLDHDIIKTDILYEFLGNVLKKNDPLTINNLHHFYKQVFRNIFHFYFKKEQKLHSTYASLWDIDSSISQIMNIPVRLAIYRDVLYNQQVKKYCETSPTLAQVNFNYNVFKNVIINNEFQDMYISHKLDTFMMNNNHYKLLSVYTSDINQDNLIKEIQKLPIIYKLLRCVRIINPKVKPYNEMLIKPDVLKLAVQEEILYSFRNIFNESQVIGIVERIAQTFTESILSGEYINLLSLSTVRINHISFITQVRKFVNLCIQGASHSNGNTVK